MALQRPLAALAIVCSVLVASPQAGFAQNTGGQPDEEGKTRINMKLRQQDLADMVGATRESVNKMLKTYKQKSLIRVQRGFITIMDKEAR